MFIATVFFMLSYFKAVNKKEDLGSIITGEDNFGNSKVFLQISEGGSCTNNHYSSNNDNIQRRNRKTTEKSGEPKINSTNIKSDKSQDDSASTNKRTKREKNKSNVNNDKNDNKRNQSNNIIHNCHINNCSNSNDIDKSNNNKHNKTFKEVEIDELVSSCELPGVNTIRRRISLPFEVREETTKDKSGKRIVRYRAVISLRQGKLSPTQASPQVCIHLFMVH